MSDFDKEAEREKLRQQYENEKEERKSTQRMSELLLQGATMTGKHCDNCGDPIFRMNGNEFCPTCQGAGANAEAAEATTEQTGNEAATETEPAGEATDIPVESGEEAETDARAEATEERSGSERTGEHTRVQPSNPPQNAPSQSRRASPSQTENRNRRERAQQPETRATGEIPQGGPTGDLSVARGSLVRKLTTLAREAEETNDVGHSRELLAATREAAEALAALDRANR